MTPGQHYFPAEWEPQSGVMLTWPDDQTDWAGIIEEVKPVYEQVAREILLREKLLVVCRDKKSLPSFLRISSHRLIIREMELNDTWARDHGPLSVRENGKPFLLNFYFNGWGMKFDASHDNRITSNLWHSGAFRPETGFHDYTDFVLEGGAIESNGAGCLMTTTACLLNKNRNPRLSRETIERLLLDRFHAEKVIWLNHGFVEGDDTDSHIDTLARFCPGNAIAYVCCADPADPHYEEWKKMEEELRIAVGQDGIPFRLVPLPLPDAIRDEEGNRLPATYANFLVLNQAVLVPLYGVPQDREAIDVVASLFPDRVPVGIYSVPLIRQHGSIHCISMQFPEGIL